MRKGDAIVIPAGVGHRLLDDFQSGFEMVGSYPVGKEWDMCYGDGERDEEEEEEAGGVGVEGIKDLGWFEMDPLYGNQGPVLAKE